MTYGQHPGRTVAVYELYLVHTDDEYVGIRLVDDVVARRIGLGRIDALIVPADEHAEGTDRVRHVRGRRGISGLPLERTCPPALGSFFQTDVDGGDITLDCPL